LLGSAGWLGLPSNSGVLTKLLLQRETVQE
jgi:hypothetical protein